MTKGAVTCVHTSPTVRSPEHSPQASAAVGSLASRSVKPVITDPRIYFAVLQNKLPKHVRVNHVERKVLCHQNCAQPVDQAVAFWNIKYPNQHYDSYPVAGHLWEKLVIKGGI